MKYYVYHIIGKKVGVTRDLQKRVTEQQGYLPSEYEVLLESDDIDIVSDLELKLQELYGYRKDREPYKQLFNKMRINATEQTSTFPCPVNKLKGRLMDSKGLTWETEHGTFYISSETIPWILQHVQTSMFNENRCYIYNKAYKYKFLQGKEPQEGSPNQTYYKYNEGPPKDTAAMIEDPYPNSDFNELIKTVGGQLIGGQLNHHRFDSIRKWAEDRGIYAKGDKKTQYAKLMEESGELARAILKEDRDEFVDAIGDMVVVLTNLAHLGGTSIENCIDSAYDVISERKGKMKNGTFVKD